MTKSGELWGTTQEDALIKGNLVHNILSEIDTREDLPRVMDKFRINEEFSEVIQKELLTLISAVINHPDLNIYFSPGARVLREKDIVSPNGEILRPDRLNFNGKKVTILDYKTGRLRPGHREQMEGYASILDQMGFEIDKKVLIYINNDVTITFV